MSFILVLLSSFFCFFPCLLIYLGSTAVMRKYVCLCVFSINYLCYKEDGIRTSNIYLCVLSNFGLCLSLHFQEDNDDVLLKTEKEVRQKVSGVLQRIILLFRAAHCSCSAAQWYITQLKWARKVMQKVNI